MTIKQPVATEHQEQVATIDWCSLMSNRYTALGLIYAIPNGSHRHISVAVKLKREGVRRSIPDLHLPVARGEYHSLYIEMKRTNGRATKDQKDMHDLLRAEGNRVEVCKGASEAIEAISDYLGIEQ